MTLEFGRPSVGTKVKELEVVTIPLAQKKVIFEPCNPSTFLFDTFTGAVKEDVKEEKVLSAIVEFIIPEAELEEITRIILDASGKCNTVFSWGIAACYSADGSLPIIERFEKLGLHVPQNMKVNVGLGRGLKEE
jgi:protein involved in ribonucleotide reduction